MRAARLRAGAWGAAGSSQPGDLRSCTAGAPFPRQRGKLSLRQHRAALGTLRLRSAPLPLRALCPLPPPPNRLKPKLALAAAGARGSGLRVAPGRERGAPPLGQKGTLTGSGWRTSGGLLGHLDTGRPRSSRLPLFPPASLPSAPRAPGAPPRLRGRGGPRRPRG